MENNIGKTLTKVSERYSELTALRVAMQLIPTIGGSLDTLFASAGSKIQLQRLEHFVRMLSSRFDKFDHSIACFSEEELQDLVLRAMELSSKTRQDEKRAAFAEVVFKFVSQSKAIDESESVLRLIAELDIVGFHVLHVVNTKVPLNSLPFNGIRAFRISEISTEMGQGLPSLAELLHQYPIHLLKVTCSSLISKGLLRDEGVGRWSGRALDILAPTDEAIWLEDWIKNNPN